MSTLPDLKAGVWKHWKGPLYLVLGFGHDANYEGRDVVVYIGLELVDAHTGPRLAARTVEDFFAWVHPSTGETVQHQPSDQFGAMEEHPVQRFTYVGPTWEGPGAQPL